MVVWNYGWVDGRMETWRKGGEAEGEGRLQYTLHHPFSGYEASLEWEV